MQPPFFFVLFSCEDPNYPENIRDEEDQGKSTPLVTEIQPYDGAFAGIDTIIINGQNFSEDISENLVFFNGMTGTVINASTTSLNVITTNAIFFSILSILNFLFILKNFKKI